MLIWQLGAVEIIRWRNARGDAMEGTLLAPPGHVAGRRYPLIVDAYPLVGGADWLAVLKSCPVEMDDVPRRDRQLPKRRRL